MRRSRLALTLAAASVVLAACQELPTDPVTPGAEIPVQADHSEDHDYNLVLFDYGLCTLTNAATGAVECSWIISGGPALFNVRPLAVLDVTYSCVNPSTGRYVTSQREEWVSSNVHTANGSSTQTNLPLDLPVITNSFTGKNKKFNACKGNNVVEINSTLLVDWALYVDNWYDGQPDGAYRYTCLASNYNVNGWSCLVPD